MATPSERVRRVSKLANAGRDEASVKVRTGAPGDDPADLGEGSADVWAGVLPLALVPGTPVPDAFTGADVAAPASVAPWRRP